MFAPPRPVFIVLRTAHHLLKEGKTINQRELYYLVRLCRRYRGLRGPPTRPVGEAGGRPSHAGSHALAPPLSMPLAPQNKDVFVSSEDAAETILKVCQLLSVPRHSLGVTASAR
jgi:hypothetical protein